MPKFKLTWKTTEADTGRPFTCESVVEEEGDGKDLASPKGMTCEPAPDDSPLYDWRTVKAPG